MNKKGANAKMATTIGVFMLLAVIVAVGVLVWSVMNQPTAADITTATTSATVSSLTGKPATLSVDIRDDANDGVEVRAPIYVITDPVVSADSITGGFAADGTSDSASGKTDITSGINVGGKYVVISGNNSYIGFPTEVLTIKTQADLLTVNTHSISTAITETVEDENGVSLVDGGGSTNLTLAGSDVATLELLRIKQTTANTALNVAGFYFDKVAGTNISSIEITGSDSPALTKSTLNLESTEADDIVFLFDSPILLKEQETLDVDNAIKITADSDGCQSNANAGEDIVFYTLDKIWTKSSVDANKMIYAYESDAASPADVGLANPSFTIKCIAS